ncbi:hypothetical protein Hanom_Chr09g00799111 [Helianthus anomalus]
MATRRWWWWLFLERERERRERERERCCLLAKVKKQTIFFLQTAEVWYTSSATDVCRCGSQTADVLSLRIQTPNFSPL